MRGNRLVLFLALLEGGLRLGGYGRSYPLFIANEFHPEYLLANPQLIKRYFSDPSDAVRVSIDIAFFKAEKSPGALRLFVQGGSTAAGFPFGAGASLAGMLQQRLRREGRTSVVVTHEVRQAAALADQAIVLARGRVEHRVSGEQLEVETLEAACQQAAAAAT